ncbi:MAG: STAS domain-containing protein [Pseudomonadota bacterium]
MNYKSQQSGDTVEISLSGRFTFGDHTAFRKLIEEMRDSGVEKQILDLSEIDFIDSAGLGMLLLARDEGEKSRSSITLRGAKGQVKRMLEVARFDTLFKLEN